MDPAKAAATQQAIGARIRALREEKGLTLTELARRAGTSLTHLSEIERGLSNMRIDTVDRLARALGVLIFDVLNYDAETDERARYIDLSRRLPKAQIDDAIRKAQEEIGAQQKRKTSQASARGRRPSRRRGAP